MNKPDETLLTRLNQLTPAQREALLQKLQQQKTKTAPAVTIPAIQRQQADYPLSFAQQRLWFLEQLSDSHASYNIAAAFRLEGVLDTKILEKTFQTVITRHESLRTVFTATSDGARQKVLEQLTWNLPVIDIDNNTGELEQLIHNEANTRFNLETGPLFRASIFRISGNVHILTVVLHHIISDAWSSRLLLAEISHIYTQILQGKTPSLPSNPVHYIDYTLWQQDFLQQAAAAEQLQYWQDSLSDFSNLDLPTDKLRPAISTYNGGFERIDINAQATQTLKLWCKQNNITLFSALLACYEIFLYRYTQQTDFCVGIPIANRHHNDTENIMGFFVNSLALRSDIANGDNFSNIAGKIQNRVLSAQGRQDIPFEKLVLSLPNVERNPAINPVFQTFFSLTQDDIDTGLKLPGISVDYIPADIDGTKFDLSLTTRAQGEVINCHFEYNRDLFLPASIQSLSKHFIRLVEQLCLQPETSVEKIHFLTEEEYALQMDCKKGWNATEAVYPHFNAVQELFEIQVIKTPGNIAVADENSVLTYAELNRESNKLAYYLASQGITRNTPVAVCLERGTGMSIALFAILKAGGAYVPLPTDLPLERLRFICSDTQASILISDHAIDTGNLAINNLLIADNTVWRGCPDSNLPTKNSGEDIFNIIYTSGSTGTPKGVMVPHQGIINRLQWVQQDYPLTPDDRILQKTPYNFDVSIWELFWPLTTGNPVFFARPEGHKDPEYLRDIIREKSITILQFVPSMLGLFLQTRGIESCTSLKKVFTAGEALQLKQNEAFFQQFPSVELHNFYGPTEASVSVSYYTCRPDDTHRSIPIGKPFRNTQLHILDKQLQPLPIGATGELYIGGIGLALGYWNQPELTSKAFIDNPYYRQGHPSKKLYKTGDVVRYLPDGDIEYLGRNDHQVKIRGFRIELGEIETQLRKLKGVEDVIVINRDINDSTQLIAYIVSREPLLDNSVYAAQLKQYLPEYMLPTAYYRIDSIPLSSNGKIDRKQLPDIDLANLHRHVYVAPRNTNESVLANIWQDLLGIDKVGVLDNFFELGGHSLLAAQLLTRIRDTFHIELPLRTLFEINTVEGLAKIISAMSFAGEIANDTINDDDFEEGIL